MSSDLNKTTCNVAKNPSKFFFRCCSPRDKRIASVKGRSLELPTNLAHPPPSVPLPPRDNFLPSFATLNESNSIEDTVGLAVGELLRQKIVEHTPAIWPLVQLHC
ncbi:hypothetical protein CBL_00956 [Carabus blaptoides fortunei]